MNGCCYFHKSINLIIKMIPAILWNISGLLLLFNFTNLFQNLLNAKVILYETPTVTLDACSLRFKKVNKEKLKKRMTV